MADAKQCDVCKEHMSEREIWRRIGGGYTMKLRRAKRRKWGTYGWTKFDICDKCMADFGAWSKAKREAS